MRFLPSFPRGIVICEVITAVLLLVSFWPEALLILALAAERSTAADFRLFVGGLISEHLSVAAALGWGSQFIIITGGPASIETIGRPTLPPGIYFRLLLIGCFEGVDPVA